MYHMEDLMKLVTVREFRSKSGVLLGELEEEGEIVLTSNGRPVAVVSAVSGDDLEEQLMALRRGRALVSLEKIRESARRRGLDALSAGEIERAVKEVRRGRGGDSGKGAGRKAK